VADESPAGARSRHNDGAGGEGQVVARIEAVPDGAEGKGDLSSLRSLPAVKAAVDPPLVVTASLTLPLPDSRTFPLPFDVRERRSPRINLGKINMVTSEMM